MDKDFLTVIAVHAAALLTALVLGASIFWLANEIAYAVTMGVLERIQ